MSECQSAAGETRIEMTPEMIEAGADEFDLYNLRFDRPPDIVVEVYRTMAKLAPDRA
jgi:hypothetical protein